MEEDVREERVTDLGGTSGRGADYALFAAISAVAIALVILVPRALEPRDYASDEAAKISETFYFRLVYEGRFSDRAWFESDVERANPPVAKYVYGIAVRTAGAPLPDDARLHQDATLRYVPPPGREQAFREALGPVRAVSAIAMALVIGVVVWMASRMSGFIAAAIAFLLLWRHFLTTTLGVTALFDALQEVFIVMAFALLAVARGSIVIRAALAGVAIALAFQTRLNGILTLAPALLLIAASLEWHWRARAVAAALMLTLCGAVTIVVNPFYWAPGPDGTTLPFRVAERVQWQFRDANAIVSTYDASMRPANVIEKGRFALTVLSSGVAGKAMLLGLFLAAAAALGSRTLRVTLLSVAIFTALFVSWLPLFWERYVFPPLPLLTLLSSAGYAAALEYARSVVNHCRKGHAGAASK